jgi:hypothetical protein
MLSQSGLIFALNEHKHSRDKVIDNRGASLYVCLNLCVNFQLISFSDYFLVASINQVQYLRFLIVSVQWMQALASFIV